MTDSTLLVLNLGSTSTKIAVYVGDTCQFSDTIRHTVAELAPFAEIRDQYAFRKAAILACLADHGVGVGDLTAIVSRGGLFAPMPAGCYAISDKLAEDARTSRFGTHACNLSCEIAFDLGRERGIPALTVDPVTSDELCDEARFSGLPQIRRRSIYHALNQKAIARRLADDLAKNVDELSAIVVHLGGGISIGAHTGGRVIDVNNALDGDGPFSPERAGTLPAGDLVALCFSGQYAHDDIKKMLCGKGGLVAHLGTTDGEALEARIAAGDVAVRKTVEAMAYHIAKEIGAAASVLYGQVDAIAVTGGLAHWTRLVNLIKARVRFIAPVRVYPGEDEIGALAQGALRVLAGEEAAKIYG